MRTSILTTILFPLFSIAVAADVVPAVRRSAPESYIDARQITNPLLGKRQFCNAAYPYICSAIDGDSMCMAESEVCCQVIAADGTYPFVCDVTHPYCCPSENGIPQCGSDETCGGGGFEAAPSHALATESSGVAPTRKTAAGGATETGVAIPTKTNAAERVGVMDGGVLVAAMLGGLAVL